MKTQILSSKNISTAAALLRKGELVAFPTETVYGLGASIFQKEAIQKIYDVKQRPADNPLIAHIGNEQQIHQIAQNLPQSFFKLYAAFFPGPLTLVVERRSNIPSIVSAGMNTIALRMPSHPVALELLKMVEVPLVAPSANLSGKPSPTLVTHVLEDLEGKIAAILDGGECIVGIESTILDLVSFEQPTILRPGMITAEEIESVLKSKVAIYTGKSERALCPGMKYRHYAPNTPVKVFYEFEALKNYLQNQRDTKRLILSQKQISTFSHYPLTTQKLYSSLRYADKENYEEIIIFCDREIQKQIGLMNRILRIMGES